MLKVLSDGSVQRTGEPWNLTEDDLGEIMGILADHSTFPNTLKMGGRWIQRNNRDILEGGYQIFTPEALQDG